VIGVQVGVDDVGDRRAELRRPGDVDVGVRGRIDHQCPRIGRDDVGQAAAAGPLDLEHVEPRDPEIHRT
jgi:hypothetical protein